MLNPNNCAAIVVGIDDYAFSPLTSCVNDALAVRGALIAHGLVDESRIALFTAPRDPVTTVASDDATSEPYAEFPSRDALSAALYHVCRSGENIERFYFYFAGHGLLRHLDSARSRTSSVIIPADVTDIESQGAKLIDLADLVGKFSLRGPMEQLFIVDACRDLPYEGQPDVGPIGWGFVDQGLQRKQAVIQSVPPLGKAIAQSDGHGMFTSHFLDALNGAGTAKHYDDELDGYVVRVKSALDYVRGQIERTLNDVPLWTLHYSLPQVGGEGYHDMEPLRVLDHDAVPDVPFTIHIEPDEVAPVTKVEVRHRGFALHEHSMPPRLNHQAMSLRPDRYKVIARSDAGAADPSQALIDARETDSLTVRVGGIVASPPPNGPFPSGGTPPPSAPSRTAAIFSSVPPVPNRGDIGRRADAPSRPLGTGRLNAMALEQQTRVEVESLQPPFTQMTGVGSISTILASGAYEIRFRLGNDVFSRTQVYLDPDEVLTITPQADLSPLVSEAVGVSIGPSIKVSESIGEIQAALPSTLLTLVGLKSFDTANSILQKFKGVVPLHNSQDYANRPIVVVLAYDGIGWKQDPRSLLDSARIRIALHDGTEKPVDVPLAPLLSETFSSLPGTRAAGRGFQRIALGVVQAPEDSFRIELQSAEFGSASLAAASIDRRLTVVVLNLHPDGTLDVSQSLLRLPGLKYPDEPAQPGSESRIVRDLMLGQRLYGSRELVSPSAGGSLTDLLMAKWTDPIVTTMALLSEHRRRDRTLRQSSENPTDMRLGDWEIEQATGNLRRFFAELPDVRVVDALFHDPRPFATDETGPDSSMQSFLGLVQLVTRQEIPVLQDAARALLPLLKNVGLSHPLLEETVRRAHPGDVWTVRVTPEDAADPALLEYEQSRYTDEFVTTYR